MADKVLKTLKNGSRKVEFFGKRADKITVRYTVTDDLGPRSVYRVYTDCNVEMGREDVRKFLAAGE